MGLNYSYEMWVPQERLYEFLKVVNKYSGKGHTTVLNWSDGRSLAFFGSNLGHERRITGKLPFDYAIDKSFGISLVFDSDEVLSQSDFGSPDREKCEIGRISLGIELSPSYISWLDNEEPYARVHFTAVTSDMSEIFLESTSIRRGFIDVAHNGGASSCCIDIEEDYGRLIFLDGKEIDEKIKVVDKHNYQLPHPRELRFQLDPTRELNENENKLLICQNNEELSLDDVLVRLDWTRNSEDSGVRGAAVKSLDFWMFQLIWEDKDFKRRNESSKLSLTWLSRQKNDDDKKRAAIDKSWAEIKGAGVENAMCEIALEDNDWRVRYLATDCLEKFTSEQSENVLSRIANDENYAVRTIAAKALLGRQRFKYRSGDVWD